jgi:hypothetical protein
VALAATGLLAVAPALAASSVDQPFTFGKYYEQNGRAGCTNINACAITFSKIPSGKVLFLERVACSVQMQPSPLDSASLAVFRSPSESFLRQQPLAPSLTSEDSFNGVPVFFYAIEKTTRYPFGNGSPTVRVFQTLGSADSQLNMACQISGTLLP